MFNKRTIAPGIILALAVGCSPHVEEEKDEPTVERIGLPMPQRKPVVAVDSNLSHRIEAALKSRQQQGALDRALSYIQGVQAG